MQAFWIRLALELKRIWNESFIKAHMHIQFEVRVVLILGLTSNSESELSRWGVLSEVHLILVVEIFVLDLSVSPNCHDMSNPVQGLKVFCQNSCIFQDIWTNIITSGPILEGGLNPLLIAFGFQMLLHYVLVHKIIKLLTWNGFNPHVPWCGRFGNMGP